MSAGGPTLTEQGNKEVSDHLPVPGHPAVGDHRPTRATSRSPRTTRLAGRHGQVRRQAVFWHEHQPCRAATPPPTPPQAVKDTIKDVLPRRKPISDFKDAVATWKTAAAATRYRLVPEQRLDKPGTGQVGTVPGPRARHRSRGGGARWRRSSNEGDTVTVTVTTDGAEAAGRGGRATRGRRRSGTVRSGPGDGGANSVRSGCAATGPLLIMTVPAVVLLLVFAYVPMFGLVTAFQNYDIYDGFWHSQWVGLRQLPAAVRRPACSGRRCREHARHQRRPAGRCTSRSRSCWPCCSTPSSAARIRSFVQSVVYLPHFFSWVLVVTVFQEMLGGAGALNTFLRQHGLATWDIMTNPDDLQVPGHRAGGLEGSRLGHHRLPRRARRDRPEPVRGGRGRRGRAGGGGCGTSRCPACAASSS